MVKVAFGYIRISPKLSLMLKNAYKPSSKLQQPLIVVNNGFKPLFFCWTYLV